jgi:hypothetical protein
VDSELAFLLQPIAFPQTAIVVPDAAQALPKP